MSQDVDDITRYRCARMARVILGAIRRRFSNLIWKVLTARLWPASCRCLARRSGMRQSFSNEFFFHGDGIIMQIRLATLLGSVSNCGECWKQL